MPERGVGGDVSDTTGAGVVLTNDFDSVYREHYADALALAVALTGDRAASEDLVQEAFVRLYRNFAKVQRPGAFVRVALINLCRNRYRGLRRESARLARSAIGGAEVEAACEVLDVLDDLPYRQRAVLVQRYWLGWSEAEIAESLGCRPGTVKSLASRALATLKEELT